MAKNRYTDHIDALRKYRSVAMKKLYSSNTISNLINSTNPEKYRGKDLVYKNIFPYAYVPDTTNTSKVFITIELGVPRVYNRTFKEMVMTVYIFGNQQVIETPNGLITDLLAEEVDKIFSGSSDFGLGNLELSSISDFTPIQRFHGIAMIYEATEFNRPSNLVV